MSFQTTLENLRAKPHHVRSRIAFWSSFGITAIIFMFWLGSFSAAGSSSTAVAAAVDKAGAPGQSLIAGVGGFFVDLKEMFFGSKKIKYAEVEVTPGNK
ncbi:MAG: hypothetical protein AAB365_03840 [Patescibacteria group bacterium]